MRDETTGASLDSDAVSRSRSEGEARVRAMSTELLRRNRDACREAYKQWGQMARGELDAKPECPFCLAVRFDCNDCTLPKFGCVKAADIDDRCCDAFVWWSNIIVDAIRHPWVTDSMRVPAVLAAAGEMEALLTRLLVVIEDELANRTAREIDEAYSKLGSEPVDDRHCKTCGDTNCSERGSETDCVGESFPNCWSTKPVPVPPLEKPSWCGFEEGTLVFDVAFPASGIGEVTNPKNITRIPLEHWATGDYVPLMLSGRGHGSLASNLVRVDCETCNASCADVGKSPNYPDCWRNSAVHGPTPVAEPAPRTPEDFPCVLRMIGVDKDGVLLDCLGSACYLWSTIQRDPDGGSAGTCLIARLLADQVGVAPIAGVIIGGAE